MKKNPRKSKPKGNLKQNLLPFIFSPTYTGYKPGMSLPKAVKGTEQSSLGANRQILIEFTPDNYIDSMNSEVNILITPILPK